MAQPIDPTTAALGRIETKLNLVLRLQTVVMTQLEEVINAKDDEARQLSLIAQLRASAAALDAAIAANQPIKPLTP